MCLMCFGYIAVLFLLRAYGPRSRAVNIVLAILLFFTIPQIFVLLGFAYISLGFHDWVQGKMMQRIGAEQQKRR